MGVYEAVVSLAKRRGFFNPSFEIYGGVSGFYDYGPLGCGLKRRIEEVWRDYYVRGEGFVEIETPTIAPEEVFKASSHLTHFADIMATCKRCGRVHKAAELVGDQCPSCGAPMSKKPFNLMFKTGVAVEQRSCYLRPETAQGMFIDFPLLYRYGRERLPLGVVQIGKSYRNEISPRHVLRLREFTIAEGELFLDPLNLPPRYEEDIQRSGEQITLVPHHHEEIRGPIKEAVQRGLLTDTIAHYILLTHRYMLEVGVDPHRFRFRQHEPQEMAHYASDCWDGEALTERFGWVELVGIADRTTYDLEAHSRHSGVDMRAFRRYPKPRVATRRAIRARPGVLGPMFREKAAPIKEMIEALEPDKVKEEGITISLEGQEILVPPECYQIVDIEEKVAGERFIPRVIEPSYGIDRIFYVVLEHAYTQTGDRTLLRLPPKMAPVTVGVFPLMAKDGLDQRAQEISAALRNMRITSMYDEDGSIGRRYARADEIGVPYCVTTDYQTLEDDTVTIRDRDSTEQRRVNRRELVKSISTLLER